MTFLAMNTNDLYTLLAAPAVSRTLFFTRLLAHPHPLPKTEPPADAQPLAATAKATPPGLPAAQPPPTNSPA